MKIASSYLVNSPPGEFIDVFNGACRTMALVSGRASILNLALARIDVRVLVNNDTALQAGVAGAFQEYNTEQFTPVDMPGQSYKVRRVGLHALPRRPQGCETYGRCERASVCAGDRVQVWPGGCEPLFGPALQPRLCLRPRAPGTAQTAHTCKHTQAQRERRTHCAYGPMGGSWCPVVAGGVGPAAERPCGGPTAVRGVAGARSSYLI
jgi:hypothetical protein